MEKPSIVFGTASEAPSPAPPSSSSFSVAESSSQQEKVPKNLLEVTDLIPSVTSPQGRPDFMKIVDEFGCSLLERHHIQRIERLTGLPVPPLLRREIFFSHRDFEEILRVAESGEKFYIYTGRGPSAGSLHLGHLVPFLFVQYLQQAFDVPVVVQMTTDEKFLNNPHLTMDEILEMNRQNVHDILAVGLNPEKTFIFANTDFIDQMFPTVLQIQRRITVKECMSVFGMDQRSSIGSMSFPAMQAAPSFPSLFRGNVFPSDVSDSMRCLIICGIDQDPYFRLTRDVAPKLGFKKPCMLHSRFIPSLQGVQNKMSSSSPETAIFLSDTPEQIKTKIMKQAFSGGRATAAEQRLHGADLSIDVPFHYLQAFLTDDEELEQIRQDYSSGKLLTGHVKQRLVTLIVELVAALQARRLAITDETIKLVGQRRLIFS